ncbi:MULTISPECIES: hypothetical protein [Rhodomicrobium]|uniref:hypothetical protein n=1 Tax=Rhodomicrobium TaxID=1068 RepID=UPI000B4ADDF6|nr:MULTISPECIES: hypothetical protein [Rhodomicrobium]
MTATIINLIIQLVAGAGGANVLANAVRKLDLGPLGNTIIGALGGLGGGSLAGAMMTGGATALGTTAGLDFGTLLTQVIAGGVGGPVLTAVVAMVKNAMAGQRPA